ncbi:GGDEF domain-containing protein [Massilia sp. Dwa41.01b]|uniref:GGDEF domain-containing protein n=1 Tax=Massilia sp. Dwa41.01b TaxID=2709302 RepID=UPI00160077F3|nr:GGDEF domain-containing protein [Massilia sp. Dwa41.01b]QNA88632.1 GGDEF domain-containing protein [Massilia sp. Dwa41.01b]
MLDAVGATPVDAGSCQVAVTLSAGVVYLPCPGAESGALDWQGALRLADWALYHGKENGRNQAWIVTGLLAPVPAVLADLDGAGHGSLPPGLLDLHCVRGPRQQDSA